MLLVATVMGGANAQVITDMDANYVYLEGGVKIPYASLPPASYHINGTIEGCINETAYRAYAKEARHYTRSGAGAYYGGGVYGGVMPVVFGGNSSSFSVHTKNVGFDTYSTEFGGYKSSGTGLRVGDVNIRMSNSGYRNRTSTATPSYTRSATTSNVKNNAVSNASVRNTTATTTGKPIKATKEIRVSSLIPNGF